MTLFIFWCLSCWACACLGALLGSPSIVQRRPVTRLVFVRGGKEPRTWTIDCDNLDDLEDWCLARFCEGRLRARELGAFDNARRFAERRTA